MFRQVLLALVVCSTWLIGDRVDARWEIEPSSPAVDAELLDRIWMRLKREVNVPDHIVPPPLVLDWNVPITARMGFQFPTKEFPNERLLIALAPRTLDKMEPPLMVLWGIGHELTHFVFLMRENNYTYQQVYKNEQKHHCDPEFLRVTKLLADEIWQAYHDDTTKNKMYAQADYSCQRNPEQ